MMRTFVHILADYLTSNEVLNTIFDFVTDVDKTCGAMYISDCEVSTAQSSICYPYACGNLSIIFIVV